ncbi:hypothetical protein [Hymenobacter elongatus]|uniref:Uncharacterized protein n=1 Tax=Hymenobacter elongatus TaxID=877208 RepID=A0A4Z0PNP1_9BACT|nr:hypothetical protein [Hymenobacter elongatus]TGE17844.1 hypothetical protein E5J99_06550 [Hymenobacter elongatus]
MRITLVVFALLLTARLGWAQKVQPQLAGQLSAPTGAPAPLPGSYRFGLDSLLTALDKNQVPSGILYDRVFPVARLDAFGQALVLPNAALVCKIRVYSPACVACLLPLPLRL